MIVDENTKFIPVPLKPVYYYSVPKNRDYCRLATVPLKSFYEDERGMGIAKMRSYYDKDGILMYHAALAPELNIVFMGV